MRSGAGRRVSGGARRAREGPWQRLPAELLPALPPQESTPPGTAALRLSPGKGERRAVATRQLRVLLTPLAVAGRRLPQKRLLSAYGGAEGTAPAGKKLCPEPSPRKPAPASPPATPPAGSPAGNGWDGAWDAESDGSDAGTDAAPVSARPEPLPQRRELLAPWPQTGGGFVYPNHRMVVLGFSRHTCIMSVEVKFARIFPL